MSKPLASMPSDLRIENRKNVLRAFHESGELTANEVSLKTGISRQTVKKCIEYYLANGQLMECGKGNSSSVGGKRPELYKMNEKSRLLCISLHHHDVNMTVTDLHYHILARWNSGQTRILSLDMLWDLIRTGKEKLFAQVDMESLISVGFSSPLGRDREERVIVATPFPYWPETDYGRSIKTALQELFPQAPEIKIVSDGRAAGGAVLLHNTEFRTGGVMATIYSSTGIGGSLFRDGRPVYGRNLFVGAFGHIIVSPEDPEPCSCGGKGCLERMVNRQRMRRRLAHQKEAYMNSVLSDIPVEEVTFSRLFKGSEQGDRLCQKESLYYADQFSIALRSIVLAADPDLVVFQGDFGQADYIFRQELQNAMSQFKYSKNSQGTRIEYDTRPLDEQETMGMTYLMISDYLENPENYRKSEEKKEGL